MTFYNMFEYIDCLSGYLYDLFGYLDMLAIKGLDYVSYYRGSLSDHLCCLVACLDCLIIYLALWTSRQYVQLPRLPIWVPRPSDVLAV